MNKNETVEETVIEEKKKIDIKKVLVIFLLVIVSLVGIFWLSTYLRWNSEIADKHEIIYYGQEGIKVAEIKNFFGEKVKTEVEDGYALLLYCSSEYGDTCVTGDFTNSLENSLRNPFTVVSIVLLVDFILFYLLIKDKQNNKIFIYVVSAIIGVFGLFILGREGYKIADYYLLVNNTDYVVNGTVFKGLVTESKDSFVPVVNYETVKGKYTKVLDHAIRGDVKKEINQEITLYHHRKNHEIVTSKKTLYNHIVPAVVGMITIVVGVIYLNLNKKETKIEEESNK